MGCRDQYTIVILRNSQKGIANDLPTLGLYVSEELVAYFRFHMKAQRSKTVSADLYTPNASNLEAGKWKGGSEIGSSNSALLLQKASLRSRQDRNRSSGRIFQVNLIVSSL